MTAGTIMLLALAGVAAGLTGSIAGLASLFSYPALLAVGLPATAANVTNTVALAFSSMGSVAGSQPELVGQAHRVRRWAPVVVLGGTAGAALLLLTPPGVFERVVPLLVGGASMVLLVQPRIRAAALRRAPVGDRLPLIGLFLIAGYGGYFGAAAGVLMLALVLVTMPLPLLQANALKNVWLGLANGVAALGFALFGPVEWAAVPPLAVGLFAGAWAGPALARRLPTTALRHGIGLAGLGLAVALAVDAYGLR